MLFPSPLLPLPWMNLRKLIKFEVIVCYVCVCVDPLLYWYENKFWRRYILNISNTFAVFGDGGDTHKHESMQIVLTENVWHVVVRIYHKMARKPNVILYSMSIELSQWIALPRNKRTAQTNIETFIVLSRGIVVRLETQWAITADVGRTRHTHTHTTAETNTK